MTDNSLFKPEKIMASAAAAGGRESTIFDDLNLPPAVADFLSLHYRRILLLISLAVVVILGFSFVDQYFDSREERASLRLSQAMAQTEAAARVEALEEVRSSFGATGAGLWSRVELAHLARDRGALEEAAGGYRELLGDLPDNDPRLPALRLSLAQVLTDSDQLDEAAALYDELSVTKGFEGWGLIGSGEVMALKGDREGAREKYRQALERENLHPLLKEQAQSRLL